MGDSYFWTKKCRCLKCGCKSEIKITFSLELIRIWKTCKTDGCEKEFLPTRSDQEYCTTTCYNSQYIRKKRTAAKLMIESPVTNLEG